MKIAILELQTYDDLPTLQDKMLWARAPRIVLVWPEQGAPRLRGPLDLVLLRRYAARLGARLALVTADARVRAWARQARVPVFADVDAAQRGPWRVRYRRPRRVTRRVRVAQGRPTVPQTPRPAWVRGLAFALGVLAVVALAAFVLPGGRVVLPVPVREQTASLTLTAGGGTNALRLQARTVTVEGEYTWTVRGRHPWPARAAEGEVVVTNLGAEAVSIPAGLRIASVSEPEVVFAVQQDGQVPAGVGAQATLPVVALTPGTVGNRPAHDLQRLPAPWDLRVTVTNPEPTQGGADLPVPWPERSEYTRLRRAAEADLRAQAAAAFEALGGLWVPDSLALDETLTLRFEPAEPTAAGVLRLTLRQRFRAWVVPPDQVTAAVRTALDARLEPGWRALPETLTWRPAAAEPVPQAHGWAWAVQARRAIYPVPDAGQVARWVQGRSPTAAAAVLTQHLTLAGPPQVQPWPSVWPWMPWWAARIQVVVVPQGAAGAR